MRFVVRRLALLSVSAITALATAQAHAQSAQADEATAASQTDAVSSGDIVVTAQRREQRLRDVPIAVTVTTGAKIEQLGIRDLPDLSVRTPGVRLAQQGSSDVLTIRGVGSGFNLGFEQGVGTFVDGIYRGRSRASRASLFDIDRVEILKGPQTTFFGNNTIVGALNITTRKPSDTLQYNASALYSPSDGEHSVEGGVSVPLTDTLSARVAGKASGMDGYIYNRRLKQNEPHLNDWIGRVSLRWKPTAAFESNLRVDRARNRDVGTYGAELYDCPANPKYGPTPPTSNCGLYLAKNGPNADGKLNFQSDNGPSGFDLDMTEVGWTNRLDIGDSTLTSITSYYNHDIENRLQVVPTSIPGGVFIAGIFTPNGAETRSPFVNLESYESYSQELRFETPANRPVQFMFGGYYSHGKLNASSFTAYYASPIGALATPIDPSITATSRIASNRLLNQTDQTRSVFGSAAIKLAEPLRVNLGLRYTSVKKDAFRTAFIGRGGTTFPGPDGFERLPANVQAVLGGPRALNVQNVNFAVPSTTYNKLMPAANVQLMLGEVSAYASYSKGFKAGGYSDGNQPVQFDSEFVDAFEVGVKGNLFDRAVFFTLDVFLSKYSNLQEAISLLDPNGVIISSVTNAAKSDTKGIEFSGTWQVSPEFSLSSDMIVLDSRYKNFRGGPCSTYEQFIGAAAGCVAGAHDRSGDERAFAPKFAASLSANLTLPIGTSENVLRLDPSIYYSSSFYLTPNHDEDVKQGRYAKFDLRAGFGPEDRRWEFSIVGKNLSNAKVISLGFPGAGAGSINGILERARSIAFQVSIKN